MNTSNPAKYNPVIYKGASYIKTFRYIRNGVPVPMAGWTGKVEFRSETGVVLSSSSALSFGTDFVTLRLTPAETNTIATQNGTNFGVVLSDGTDLHPFLEGKASLKDSGVTWTP